MPTFSTESLRRLATCDKRLQRVFNEVVKTDDCTILCGHRGQAEQDRAYAEGHSQKKWPNGEHNKLPSRAVDVQLYPPNADARAQYLFAGVVIATARNMGIKLRFGGDWDGDYNIREHSLNDSVHFELVDP